jgi:hypothetical protein
MDMLEESKYTGSAPSEENEFRNFQNHQGVSREYIISFSVEEEMLLFPSKLMVCSS